MNFKNELERQVFEIAHKVCGDGVTVEHNKVLAIERALMPEVASFAGPPKKEIDVITARINPNISILVSCKEFEGSKAEPAHVQEWCAVVQTMNRYSDGTKYLGLVVCPTGFTKGCEPWATSHNIGLIPPLKGKKLEFPPETVLKMFERVIGAISKRIPLAYVDLLSAPAFFDFVFRLVVGFEGHEEHRAGGVRYVRLGSGWQSSFSELFECLKGHLIADIRSAKGLTGLLCDGALAFYFNGETVSYGADDGLMGKTPTLPACKKNMTFDNCDFELLKKLAIGQRITSAADFGDHFEFGLEGEMNLGFYPELLYIVSTKNPIVEHQL